MSDSNTGFWQRSPSQKGARGQFGVGNAWLWGLVFSSLALKTTPLHPPDAYFTLGVTMDL